jgi:hypothetical protein
MTRSMNITFATTAAPTVITPKSKVTLPIFSSKRDDTEAKVRLAIVELDGRYGDNAQPYTEAKGNPLWKSTNWKTAPHISKEKIKVCLKVGKINWVLGTQTNKDGTVEDLTHINGLTYQQARQFFTDALVWIEGMNKEHEQAEMFHELAKKAALPTTNRDSYRYDAAQDIWVKSETKANVSEVA